MNESIKQKALVMINTGESDTAVRKFIRQSTGLKKTRANELFLELKNNTQPTEPINSDSPLVIDKKYIFNKETRQYVVFLKKVGKNIVVPEAQHKAMLRAYVSDIPLDQISVKYSFPQDILTEYKEVFGWRRGGVDITDEDIENDSVEECANKLLKDKKFEVIQEIEKKSWKLTQDDADKWRKLSVNVLDLASSVLENWEPKSFSKVRPVKKSAGEFTMVIGANDWHIGEFYSEKDGYHGTDFNSDKAVRIIDIYADKIIDSVKSRNYNFKKCLCILNGDILNSCFNGETVKGTNLHNDKINSEMFETALNAVTSFIEKLATVFPEIDVPFIVGNHDGPLLSILGLAVKAYFKNSDNINIQVSSKWAEMIREGNIAILATHGGAAFVKSSLPTATNKLKTYLQDMFLAKLDYISGCKTRIVVSGHFHRFWQQDLGGIEFYCFGGLPTGDGYADALNLRSKPRQNALVLDNNNVVETLHFYFE